MELIDYIDADEGREFDTPSSDADHCENCGRGSQRLTRVPEFDYMGCDDCMEEALAVIAREKAEQDMTIRTSCIAPPIPTRDFDYTAWVDGQEEWLQGYGPTAAAAIQDLKERIEEEAA